MAKLSVTSENVSKISDQGYEASSELEDNISNCSDKNEALGQSGLANVFSKILSKQVKSNQTAILSKGQSDRVIQKRKLLTEAKEKGEDVESEESKKKKVSASEKMSLEQIQKKKVWEEIGRIKPNLLEKETERNLKKIATRGVVQLFNAVLKQQKTIDEELDKGKMTESKKEKVIGSMTKGKFLDMLKGTSVTEMKGKKLLKEERQSGSDKKDSSTWSVLRDDFMMGAKMKDWDKNSSSDDSHEANDSDFDMSDD